MCVVLTCEKVRNIVTPLNALSLKLVGVLLNDFENRSNLILRVLEETEKKFKRTVACASAHAVNGCVKIADALSHSLNCVGKSKLLVVVSVNTDRLAVLVGN